MNTFVADMHLTLEILDRWSGPWPELVAAFQAGPPVLLVSEGSSRMMPGGFARTLARRLGLSGRFDSCGGREAQTLDLTGFRVLLSSNSGRSREPLEAAEGVPALLALVGLPDGPMAKLGGPTRVFMPRAEIAIPATASVYTQVLTIAEAVVVASGGTVPFPRLRAGVAAALATTPLMVPGLRQIFWCGGEDGLADELSLKTAETTGLPGAACTGTTALHGVEELWQPNDLIVDLGFEAKDAADLARRVARTGASLARLPAYAEDTWAPLDRLCAGWLLLNAQALALGRDPALPNRVKKVGNPI